MSHSIESLKNLYTVGLKEICSEIKNKVFQAISKHPDMSRVERLFLAEESDETRESFVVVSARAVKGVYKVIDSAGNVVERKASELRTSDSVLLQVKIVGYIHAQGVAVKQGATFDTVARKEHKTCYVGISADNLYLLNSKFEPESEMNESQSAVYLTHALAFMNRWTNGNQPVNALENPKNVLVARYNQEQKAKTELKKQLAK